MLRTRVITALVLLMVLLTILFSGSMTAFRIGLTVFFAAAMWECFRLFQNRQPMVGAAIWTAAFGFILYKQDSFSLPLLFAFCVAIWALRLVPALKLGMPPFEGLANRLLNGIYGVAILGCFLAILVLFSYSPLFLLSVMAIVWVADIGAYFVGKACGKRKLAPSISPGKSWEGAIGGWLCVLALSAASIAVPSLDGSFAVRLQGRWGWAGFVLAMSLLVAASIVGDLVESQLKRRAGMKDSSNLLPGHGGVLDRIDALIPVLPLAVLLGATF